MSNEKIKVSVYCAAYNHEKYIAKTLEGFVSQKTDFDFEVIVHDDASTDETAKVISEYAEKYPDIIKPIYQTENQYSKKVKIFYEFFMKKMSGQYIAFCEGDDFWCDENKLQMQADFLDANHECIMVSHNTERISVDGERIDDMVRDMSDGYLSAEDLIAKGKARNPHFSSLMLRAELAREIKPDFFSLTTGDNAWRMFALTRGKLYYINRIMSCYRVGTPGSWNSRMKSDPEKYSAYVEGVVRFFEEYDKYTEGAYHEVISEEINKRKYTMYMSREDYKAAYEMGKLLKLGIKKRVLLWLLAHLKFVQKIYKSRKNGKK